MAFITKFHYGVEKFTFLSPLYYNSQELTAVAADTCPPQEDSESLTQGCLKRIQDYVNSLDLTTTNKKLQVQSFP